MKTAAVIDTKYGEVCLRIEQIENSRGEDVWAIVSSWITPNGNFVRLDASYEPETELADVLETFAEHGSRETDDLIKAMETVARMGL